MEKNSSLDKKTLRNYKIALDNFENFCLEKQGKSDCIPDLKESEIDVVFEFLQSWINWNHARSPRTVKNYFFSIKKYLHYRGIKIHDEEIKAELTFKRRIDEELYGLSLDDINTIFKAIPHKHRVSLMCQLSGLMRIGETVQLRKKNLIVSKQNIIAKIPANIAKYKKGRTTFFSKEASRLLRPMLRELKDDDLVFGSNENSDLSTINAEQTLRRVLEKIGLNHRYESTHRYLINTHSFRAYGITKLSRHDPNFAKKLAGQKGYLLEYDRMTDEEKLTVYEKYEHDLTIDQTQIQKEKISKLEVEQKEKIDGMNERMAGLEKILKKLSEKD